MNIITKTEITPRMMAEAYGLTCCPSTLVPESKLSHNVEAHHRLVPKLIHHGGENNRPSDLKTFYNSAQQIGFSLKQSGKGVFALMRKKFLQGMTGLGVRLSGCLHTSRIKTNTGNTLTRGSFSERGFSGFCSEYRGCNKLMVNL